MRRRATVPAVVACAAFLSACTIGPATPDPTPPTVVASFTATRNPSANPPKATGLAASFEQLKLGGKAAIAVVPVGSSQPQKFGEWETGPAWSTIKVPLAIASVRETGSVSDQISAAITESDNEASEQIWSSLGEPATAGKKVGAVLRDGADNATQVQDERVRPPYTAFGQTMWGLRDQAIFAAHLPCIARGPEIVQLMSAIVPGQQWGLSHVAGAAFKGGWGPDPDGHYLVRQFGIISVPSGGQVAVALSAEPTSGSYDDGVAMLDQIGEWVDAHLADLAGGAC